MGREDERTDLFLVCFHHLNSPCTFLPGYGGGNRDTGGSLLTVAALIVCIQAELKGGKSVLVCFSIYFFRCTFVPGCRRGIGLPAAPYSRLRRLLYAYKRNGRAGNLIWCVSTIFLFHACTFLPGCGGGGRVAGGSLLTVAALTVCIQAEQEGGKVVLECFDIFLFRCTFRPGCGGGNRVAGGSLLTVAALNVCIQAKREGGNFFLVCFNNFFIPCTFLPGCRGEPGCRRLSTYGCGACCMHTSGTGGREICFGVFQQFNSLYIFPGLRWAGRIAGGPLLTVAAILVYISGTGGRTRVDLYLCASCLV